MLEINRLSWVQDEGQGQMSTAKYTFPGGRPSTESHCCYHMFWHHPV